MKPLSDTALRVMCTLWEHEPISARELCKLLGSTAGWKSSTVYTLLHRMQDAGLLHVEEKLVRSSVSREEAASFELASRTLPLFRNDTAACLDALLSEKTLTDKEARALKRVIDRHRKEKGKEDV